MTEKKPRRDNGGSMWKNDRKEKPTHPDFTGSVTIAGKDYWLSGWLRQAPSGNRYTSLAFKAKAPKPEYVAPKSNAQPGGQVEREPGSDDDRQEEIPW